MWELKLRSSLQCRELLSHLSPTPIPSPLAGPPDEMRSCDKCDRGLWGDQNRPKSSIFGPFDDIGKNGPKTLSFHLKMRKNEDWPKNFERPNGSCPICLFQRGSHRCEDCRVSHIERKAD